ncbi:MAG: ATP-binding protein [Roseibacillus sp.]
MVEADKRDELAANEENLKSLADRFQMQEEEVRLVNARRGGLLAIIFVMGGLIMDWVVYREIFVEFLILRSACCCLVGGVLALLYVPKLRSSAPLLIHMIALLPLLTLYWMLVQIEVSPEVLAIPGRSAGDGQYYAGLNLNMVGAVLILRWRFGDGVLNASLCIGGYLAVAMAMEFTALNVITSVFFLFVTGTFACAGLFFYNRLRFAEFCLREEVLAQQEELAENHRKLQELDETKTRFFANISHELRTPLTLILAPIEKMQSLNAVRNDAKLSELVESLEDNGMRLLRLINDLLDLVRLDSGEMPVRPERFSPFVFIDGLGRNLNPMAERKRINLSWSANCEEDREVFLDRDRLEKIVLNLAVNALKFTPPSGTVSLTVGIEDEEFTLQVADNGAGMREDQISAAFERFWQADTSAAKKYRGVGIGLALVKSLTESMDGEVGIESKFGEGTTFTIRVPLIEMPAGEVMPEVEDDEDSLMAIHSKARIAGAIGRDETAPSPHDTAGQLAAAGLEGGAKRELVLVAEDESGLRRFLRGEIEEMGCGVIEACDGAEGWDLARQFQPQLIILDYMMPEMDGITLTQRLRHNDSTSQVPILLVTAAADETPRIQALEAGVSDFLTKPFTTAELRLRIRNLLERQRYQRQLGERKRELEVALDERDVALAEIKQNEARLLQAEKLSSLGRMSAGIVHEVNNPLNYVKTALHTLRVYSDDVKGDEREEFNETIMDAEEGVDRVIRIVSDLRSLTKGEATMKEEIKVADTIENARRLLSDELDGLEFTVDVPQDQTVTGNAIQLCQVFMNIIQNSAQALEGARERGVEPKVEIRSETNAEGGVRIHIRDNGTGIAVEDQRQVFDPFFTKRDVGAGMGLGLSICHSILESHKGRIEVESEPGQFTELIITFPPPRWDEYPDEDDDDGKEDEFKYPERDPEPDPELARN